MSASRARGSMVPTRRSAPAVVVLASRRAAYAARHLPSRSPHRRGWYGRGLSRARPESRSSGGHQDAARGVAGTGDAAALGGARDGRGAASEPGRDSRHRDVARHAVSGSGVPGRRHARRSIARAAARPLRAPCRSAHHRRGARSSARRGHRPSRRQAQQHRFHRTRRAEAARLRTREIAEARRRDGGHRTLTETHSGAAVVFGDTAVHGGTPAYMSPEALEGLRRRAPRSTCGRSAWCCSSRSPAAGRLAARLAMTSRAAAGTRPAAGRPVQLQSRPSPGRRSNSCTRSSVWRRRGAPPGAGCPHRDSGSCI